MVKSDALTIEPKTDADSERRVAMLMLQKADVKDVFLIDQRASQESLFLKDIGMATTSLLIQ